MNWHKKLKEIYNKLEEEGYYSIKREIYEGQISGGTAGEIFSIVLDKLINLKQTNHQAHEKIKSEIEEFIEYAKSINYLPKNEDR